MPRWPRSLERLPQPCELAAEASFHPFVLRQNLTSRCEDIRTRGSDLQLIGALRAALSEQTGDLQKNTGRSPETGRFLEPARASGQWTPLQRKAAGWVVEDRTSSHRRGRGPA